MTDKLRDAAQLALEALEAMGKPQPTLVETMKMQAHAAKKLRAALAQQDAQTGSPDLSELYAQGWLNGTQVQSLLDWCNEVDRKPPNIAYTSGPVRQLAYAIAAAVWRSYRAGMEASARLCDGRVDESANQQRNAAFRNDPYGQKRAMLDGEVAKWLAAEIRANARATEAALPWGVATPPAQRVELTDEEIWNSDTIMAINAEAGLPMATIAKLARAVIEAYERKNGIK